jgi:hypothetical protein
MRTMAAADAQMLWLSAKMPNDQFLVFAFDGVPSDVTDAITEVRRRALSNDELQVRVVDDHWWSYPRWEPGTVADEQFSVLETGQWQACLDSLRLLPQLTTTRMCWRLHVFPDVKGIPGTGTGTGTVLVVQIAHALADGTRAAQLAAALLGRRGSVAPVYPPAPGLLPWRALTAARAHRQLERDIAAGLVARPGAPRPALSGTAGAARPTPTTGRPPPS